MPDLLLKITQPDRACSGPARSLPARGPLGVLTGQVGVVKCETLKCEMESTCRDVPTVAELPGWTWGPLPGSCCPDCGHSPSQRQGHGSRSEESPSHPAWPGARASATADASPSPARPGPEAWSEPLRKACAHLCGVRPAEACREHSTASPCPGEHAPECWGQPGAAGGQRPLPDCSRDESARRQGGCVSFSPPRRSGRLPRTLLVSTQAWTAEAVPRPSRE